MLDYILFGVIFLVIALFTSICFYKVLGVRVFGGFVSMLIISTLGSLLGSYYLPHLNKIMKIKIDVSSAILGGFILIILLYIFTPKSKNK